MRLRFRASIESVPHARHRLSSWLLEIGARDEVVQDMALAVTELVTNAVEASPSASAEVTVQATFRTPDLCVEVVDEGPGFEMNDEASATTGPEHIRGRGLPIVRAVSDLVEVGRDRGRTRVTATRRLTPSQV